ncbi:MAG TPA: hypothetical protein VN132_12930 [Bdellovibrio sp.]|nr:hypothetical protein [Bdellovibrio sp.]
MPLRNEILHGMTKKYEIFYIGHSVIFGGHFLLPHSKSDNVYALFDEISDFLEAAPLGRLNEPIIEIPMQIVEDTDEEIKNPELIEAKARDYNTQIGIEIVSEKFLQTLESLNFTEYSARPVCLRRLKINQIWKGFWLLKVKRNFPLPLLQPGEVFFFDSNNPAQVYFSDVFIKKLGPLPGVEFEQVKLPLCQATPLSSYSHVEKELLSKLKEICKKKFPPMEKDTFYSIDYFYNKLREHFLDLSLDQMRQIIRADSKKIFELELPDEDGIKIHKT